MSLLFIVLFAVGLAALLVLGLLATAWNALQDADRSILCPPCNCNCDQGRACPARSKQ